LALSGQRSLFQRSVIAPITTSDNSIYRQSQADPIDAKHSWVDQQTKFYLLSADKCFNQIAFYLVWLFYPTRRHEPTLQLLC